MKTKTLARLMGAAAVLAGASSAQAANLPIGPGFFQLSDNSAEYLINCDPQTTRVCDSTAGDTTVDIGDTLHGIFIIDDVSGESILAGSGYDELSGVFEATVVNKINVGGLLVYYQFAPSAAFQALHGAGAMIAYYTDSVHEYAREGSAAETVASLEARVTDGDLYWVAGIVDSANWWYGRSELTDDVNFPLAPPNTDVGDYGFALDLIVNNSGFDYNQVPCATTLSIPFVGAPVATTADQCGLGNILTPAPSAGNVTPFDVWNDQNIVMDRVPEPASVALLSLGLLGLGAVTRRSRKSK